MDFIALDFARESGLGPPLDDPLAELGGLSWASLRCRPNSLAICKLERFRP